MKSIFLEMHNDPRGRKILEQMRIDKFVEVPDMNYDSIRTMQAFVDNNGIPADSGPDPATSTTMENAIVLFGILPRDNPIVAYGRYQPLVDYLTKATGIKTELHLEKNYQGVVNSLGQGRISLALLGPLTYLDAFKRYKVIPIARSQTSKGESFYRSAIVADSGIESISQLANKKFAFASLWSTSGNLLPRYMLAQSGIHLSQLSSYQHYNYHDTVAKKVISDEYDAGALRLSTAERYTAYGLKIIAVSDPIPTGPVAASRHTPNHIIEKFKDALLTMSSHDEGQKILMKLDPDLQGGFVTTSDNDYAGVRKMINDVPKTCGLSCHPRVSF
jgi:phosphonate transport system substrate-binding protein